MKKLMLVTCLILAGCETFPRLSFEQKTVGSYAAPEVNGAESAFVAKDMVSFLSNQFPYAKTTIVLDPIKTEFNQRFTEELARRGFGVIEGKLLPGSIEVHYAISALDNGVVARMRFQGKEASRFYALTDSGLTLGGPYSLRSAIK
jgi:hypothetical protein